MFPLVPTIGSVEMIRPASRGTGLLPVSWIAFASLTVTYLCLLFIFERVDAQEDAQAWTFLSVESADLLFHGLAVVGFQGFSALPLYDRDYADRIRAVKETTGDYPTSLDRQAGRFLQAFESDSTFELLHFLPLYFGSVQPEAVLDVFAEVANGSSARSAGEEAAFASSVLTALFRSGSQKRVLGEFGRALAEELDAFLREYSTAVNPERAAALTGAEAKWNREIVPAISEFLGERNLTGGTVMVSSALGSEGRVFAGDPESSDDDVYAVTLAHHQVGMGVSAFLLKELCYPIASGVVETLGYSADRVTAERMSGTLAVRCGSEVLDDTSPGLAREYRETFLTVATSNGIPASTFEAAFPVESAALERLRRALGRGGR